ncbi:hypothetical protein ACPOL_0892 [Acidisarcina polymorpha]|uniref:DUF4412 domain-containing protein n=1 Tax=Acidisarcina polymorpha TaxID=2211140 RepID=A0A2Z5FTS7_9BACT|nr:hypothetical protein [Acidisarcina polymorpha]AXC10249.1 hypothetical protein ACPOL_0892 [Acidisarcina polymorpha]
MKTLRYKFSGTVAALALSCFSCDARADFTYTETTQITGGSMLGMMKMAGTLSKQARQATDPVSVTVVVQGNRMARIDPERTEIIDLDAETITTIDTSKRRYMVMTFEQLKRQLEEAMTKTKDQQQKAASSPPPTSDTQVSFRVNVRNTGATKDVVGVRSNESILTLAMDATDKTSGQTGSLAITNDMWLAPEIPGYGEVRDFYARYAVKMGTVFNETLNPAMMAQYSGAGQGLLEMGKEMSKLKGTPVLQVMRMGMTTDGKPLPAASEAPLPQSDTTAMPTAADVAKQSASSAIASSLGLGGFGGFGHKKKADPPPSAASDDTAAAQTASVLVESSTQLSSFSGTAAPSSFLIPPGFKQEEYKK